MANVWDDMREAVQQSKNTLDAADKVATDMAKLLVGRLRHVEVWDSNYSPGGKALAALKRELADFNMQTHKWSEKP